MVREAAFADIEGILRIEKECFSDCWSRTDVEEGMVNPLDVWLVTEEENKLLGYCVFRILEGETELFRIAVLQEERGLGLAGKLMDEMVIFSRKRKAKSLFLEVRKSNKIAQNLYKSYGFFEEAVRKNYYQNPADDAVLMRSFRI